MGTPGPVSDDPVSPAPPLKPAGCCIPGSGCTMRDLPAGAGGVIMARTGQWHSVVWFLDVERHPTCYKWLVTEHRFRPSPLKAFSALGEVDSPCDSGFREAQTERFVSCESLSGQRSLTRVNGYHSHHTCGTHLVMLLICCTELTARDAHSRSLQSFSVSHGAVGLL